MSSKYRYNINNLNCANCAKRVEDELNKNSKFRNVIVNFNTSKLIFEADSEIELDELNSLVGTIEEGCTITNIGDESIKKEYRFSILLIAIILAVLGIYIKLPGIISIILVIVSYILLLYKPFLSAVKMFIKTKTINENTLIVISCLGAYFLGQKMEGIMVVALYTLGKILEEIAVNNTRREVSNILDIKQDYANKIDDDNLIKIDVEQIKIDDILVIKKGEKIPTDGIVIKGYTKLDMQSLTGETELVEVASDDIVLSGSINVGDTINIKATSLFEDSTVARILKLTEEATDKKAKTETFVARASRIYTPLVLLVAILVFIFLPIFSSIDYVESLYRALTFLVISCPCAIAISVPLSYFTGIGISSKNGILIKGSNYLDNLSKIEAIIFDKTGTLTNGKFKVREIKILDKNYTKEEIIEIITKGEALSNHPIARSIVELTDKKIDTKDIKEFEERDGMGVIFTINDKEVMIGSSKLCNCNKVNDVGIFVCIDSKHVATIYIDDGIKENAKEVLNNLKRYGVKTYMFTGDRKKIALDIGKKLEIDEIKYEMMPDTKYKEYEKIAKNTKVIAFVGDGINDTPVLKRADIGISMGTIGSVSAIEASDIVVMNDDLEKITLAIKISKYTNKIIKQNLIFALGIKLLILILSILGLSTMWFAVFADTGVTLLTILNTLRIMRKY